MAQRAKKTAPKRTRTPPTATGATAAVGERAKAAKKTFGKAAPRQVTAASAGASDRTAKRRAADKPSAVARAIHGIATAASRFASLFRRKDRQTKVKSKVS